MRTLQVVTDGSCDLAEALLEQWEIMTVPVSILIDGETYLERVDITTHEFYAKMARGLELPITAPRTRRCPREARHVPGRNEHVRDA